MAKTRAVLIIGGSGFVGTHLALRLREGFKVFATYLKKPVKIPGVTSIPLQVGERDRVRRIVYMAQPDVIVYAAGANNIDWAESNLRDSERVHTGGPATVSTVSEILQPKFIYLSNCFAFDGVRGNYSEDDTILPSTTLGKHKVGGENFIRGKSLNYLIVRSSPLIGRGNGLSISLLDHLRMRLDREERVELPATTLHSFAPISGFVDLVSRLVDSGPRNKTLHYGGLTKVTHYDLGRAIAQRFGYDPKLISAQVVRTRHGGDVPTEDYSLNSSLVAETLKIQPLLLEEGLDLLEKELVPPL